MKVRFLTVLRVLACAVCAVAHAVPSASAQDLAKVSEVVNRGLGRIIVTAPNGSQFVGSGFVIAKIDDDEYYLATNEHVADSTQNKYLVGFVPDHKSGELVLFDGVRVAVTEPQDIAILKITRQSGQPEVILRPLPVTAVEPSQGTEVASLGFPGIADEAKPSRIEPDFFRSSVTTGVIGRILETEFFRSNRPGPAVRIIQHDASIAKGNSGGPLVNECAEVVGINTQGLGGGGAQGRVVYQSTVSSELLALVDRSAVALKPIDQACDGTITNPGGGALQTGGASAAFNTTTILTVLAALAAVIGGGVAMNKARGGTTAKGGTRASGASSSKAVLDLVLHLSDGGESSVKLTRSQLSKGAVIGRSSKSDVVIADPRVSGRHAELRIKDKKLHIRDLQSSNGTEIDGSKLASGGSVILSSRSQVKLGNTTFRVQKRSS